MGREGLSENFLVDDDQDEQDENGDDGTGYETLLVHPKIQRNLVSIGGTNKAFDKRVKGLPSNHLLERS